jgi:hypothetical protein
VIFFSSIADIFEWHLFLQEHFNPQITTQLDESCVFLVIFFSIADLFE